MNFPKIMIALSLIAFCLPLFSVAFRDGEKLTFNVKYGIVSAGEATLEARSLNYQGRDVWYLSTNARTYPFFDVFFKVRDKVESWWDKKTLLTHKFAKTLREGNYRQYRIHTYDQDSRNTSYQKWSYKDDAWETQNMDLPFTTQDMLSAFYYARTQPMKPGDRISVNITADGRAVPTEIVVHRREKVSSIFGKIDCLVIQPMVKSEAIFKQEGNIMIWVSDDAYKIPVQLESAVAFGSFVARLTDAENVPYKVKYPNN